MQVQANFKQFNLKSFELEFHIKIYLKFALYAKYTCGSSTYQESQKSFRISHSWVSLALDCKLIALQ